MFEGTIFRFSLLGDFCPKLDSHHLLFQTAEVSGSRIHECRHIEKSNKLFILPSIDSRTAIEDCGICLSLGSCLGCETGRGKVQGMWNWKADSVRSLTIHVPGSVVGADMQH